MVIKVALLVFVLLFFISNLYYIDPSTARPVSAQRRAKSASSPIKKKEIDKEALTKTPIDANKESPHKNDTTFGSNLTSGL